MAFIEGGNEGVFNGTTGVDLVPVPAASTRRLVANLSATNRDTVDATVLFYKDKAGTQYELWRELLHPNDVVIYDKVIVLDAVDEKIVGKLLAAHTTTAPSFDAAFGDAT